MKLKWTSKGSGHRHPVARVALATVALAGPIVLSVEAGPSNRAGADTPTSCQAAPATHTSGTSFSATETLCRVFFDQGVVDQRSFSVSVSNTQLLRNRQVITVSWTGAHPTGGIISDQQSAVAALQEYPVVLMECRGVDSTTVPVSQQLTPASCWTATADERSGQWPSGSAPWSLDSYNSPNGVCPTGVAYCGNQMSTVGEPPADFRQCINYGQDQYWVPFVAADGTSYPVGPRGCSGLYPPEMSPLSSTQQDLSLAPSDTTYAKTSTNGAGTANFTIETSETNASLGCSDTVACSLVVIPIEGISCNANPTNSLEPWLDCESLGSYLPGQLGGGNGNPAPAVTGSYWYSESNWGRRISVPLNFAPPADVCSANTSAPILTYGSELMAQATQQWNPHFCLNSKLFNINHVQTPEPEAKTLLQTNAIEAAIQGTPPPVPAGQKSFFTTPTVQAPMAVSGFAIAYVIDNADGSPYTQLRLDPRLLAKLLTESYPGTNNVASGDVGISHNPLTIYDDPEFKALNPGYTMPTNPNTPETAPAATLFSIFTQSDAVWALTSYINADPEARAWLDGQPDPWGMKVNPYYTHIPLPVPTWPLLDASTNGPDYNFTQNPCLAPNPNPPPHSPPQPLVPDRPLVDNPQPTLSQVAYNLQYSIAASETVCHVLAGGTVFNLGEIGPETIGDRFMIGLVPLAATYQYALQPAALQTYVAPGAPTKFTDGTDRVFVAPNSASLQAAAGLLQPDNSVGSWQLPYTDFPGDASAAAAYPGTMLMSLDVPTRGLPAADAKDLGEYLTFAATTGQTSGAGLGQLPAGYLPMTSAAGMGNQLAYTTAAAADVTAQNGAVPPLIPVAVPPTRTGGGTPPTTTGTSGSSPPTSSVSSSTTGSSTSASGSHSSGNGAAGSGSSPPAASVPTVQPSGPTNAIEPAAQELRTPSLLAGIGGLALPLALLLLLVSVLALTVLWWLGKRRASP